MGYCCYCYSYCELAYTSDGYFLDNASYGCMGSYWDNTCYCYYYYCCCWSLLVSVFSPVLALPNFCLMLASLLEYSMTLLEVLIDPFFCSYSYWLLLELSVSPVDFK